MGTNGMDENEGLLNRTVREMFTKIEQCKDKIYNVRVTYIEIYNEQIIDLLDDKKKINPSNVTIREEKNGSISVYGLTEENIQTPAAML